MSDCFVCTKHKNLSEYTGEVIVERGGLMLTHFPAMKDEKTSRGHLLIEPRRHITDLSEMNADEAAALGELIRLGTQAVKSKLGAEHVYLFRINDKVPHLHFHLVPRYPNVPREYWGLKVMEWPGKEFLTLKEIAQTTALLKGAILK